MWLEFLLFLPLAALLYYMTRPAGQQNNADIPGPQNFPRHGTARQSSKFYLQLTDYAQYYGGIFKLHFLSKPVVVVSDYDYIQEVLVKQSAAFAGRPSSIHAEITSMNLCAISLTDAGREVTGRRQAVETFLKRFRSGIQRIEEATQISTDDLIKRCATQNGSPTQIQNFLLYTVVDVITILLNGYSISANDKRIVQSLMEKLHRAVQSEGGMLLDLYPFTSYVEEDRYQSQHMPNLIKVKDFILTVWMENRPPDGFIHFIQAMSDEEQERSFLDNARSQRNMCFEFLVAGALSASNTLTYLMNVLCHHPQVQEKLRKEVFDEIGPSRYPVLADQENMPYLRACLLEINRYISVSPLTVPHKAVQTCRLGPYTIPKDTEVWVNLWALHHDERLWEQPFEFKPERFLDDDHQLVPANHPKRKYLLPFGAGHRACVGEEFAVSRMLLITARILQNFTILPESTLEKQPSCDPRVMETRVDGLPPEFKVRMVSVMD